MLRSLRALSPIATKPSEAKDFEQIILRSLSSNSFHKTCCQNNAAASTVGFTSTPQGETLFEVELPITPSWCLGFSPFFFR